MPGPQSPQDITKKHAKSSQWAGVPPAALAQELRERAYKNQQLVETCEQTDPQFLAILNEVTQRFEQSSRAAFGVGSISGSGSGM